jgi:hypothetical protein
MHKPIGFTKEAEKSNLSEFSDMGPKSNEWLFTVDEIVTWSASDGQTQITYNVAVFT